MVKRKKPSEVDAKAKARKAAVKMKKATPHKTDKEIANELGYPPSMVSYWINFAKRKGDLPPPKAVGTSQKPASEPPESPSTKAVIAGLRDQVALLDIKIKSLEADKQQIASVITLLLQK